MNYLVASLFRVKLEILKAEDVGKRAAVTGAFHMTLCAAACDAESAAAAARHAVSRYEGFALKSIRAVSVDFVEQVNVTDAGWTLPGGGSSHLRSRRARVPCSIRDSSRSRTCPSSRRTCRSPSVRGRYVPHRLFDTRPARWWNPVLAHTAHVLVEERAEPTSRRFELAFTLTGPLKIS